MTSDPCQFCDQSATSERAMRGHLRKIHPEKIRSKSAVFAKCEINMTERP